MTFTKVPRQHKNVNKFCSQLLLLIRSKTKDTFFELNKCNLLKRIGRTKEHYNFILGKEIGNKNLENLLSQIDSASIPLL